LFVRHVEPTLGRVRIADIDVAAVRAWRAKLLKVGPGAVTVAKAYRLLRTMLNTAVEEGLIVANPCTIKNAGVERSPERQVATVVQVNALADAIEPRFRAMVLLAAYAGLRFGELAALTRANVDLDAGAVVISQALHELDSGSRVVGDPKSAAGRRRVNLPPSVVLELRHHLETYVPESRDALVFTGPKGAELRRSNFHKSWWRDAREAAGVPALHFHDLRHTGNTLAAATGASTRELMARMGHSSARAALIYQHATEDRDKAIAAALGELIAGAVPATPGTPADPFPARSRHERETSAPARS
jgi:integrase